MTEKEMLVAELMDVTDGLNEHGMKLLLFDAKELTTKEKYQATTPPERLQEIHEKESKEAGERVEKAKSYFEKSEIMQEIGKRTDYLKIVGENAPYSLEFEEILAATADDFQKLTICLFALGCIVTEKELKEKAKKGSRR